MTEEKPAVRDGAEEALSGLRRIALGPTNDAALLAASSEISPEEIAALDLFSVSEIKRGKEGFDVRLYSRLEALKALLAYEGDARSGDGLSLLEALDRSADALDKANGGEAPDAL